MNFSGLQQELQALSPEQQDRLSAFLTSLRMKRDGITAEICRRLDDKDEKNWGTWGSVKEDLDRDSNDSE